MSDRLTAALKRLEEANQSGTVDEELEALCEALDLALEQLAILSTTCRDCTGRTDSGTGDFTDRCSSSPSGIHRPITVTARHARLAIGRVR